jgi:methylenetetrahydrofolate--tRNA-(uracil-5-)-methyltransferase
LAEEKITGKNGEKQKIRMIKDKNVNIIGAGLAGCEAALFLANHNIKVKLYEQKPVRFSPAHKNSDFAELVCSNSLKSERKDSAQGILKNEMAHFSSAILKCAENSRVPAGGALAVDRDKFSHIMTQLVKSNDNINVKREEVRDIDTKSENVTLVATGPLTDGRLYERINELRGESMHFFDAAAPIVTSDSIDMEKVFAASRYDKGESDYLNCPFDKIEYEKFYNRLKNAERAPLNDFDSTKGYSVYEGCMPIETMAQRGRETLRFGPMRPVGLKNPKTGHRPWANVQLRSENLEKTLYNIVGFQTNLKFPEQKRVFSMIPGLENAQFARYGVMHRNSFINSPKVLNKTLNLKQYPNVYFAGQITGVEGYMESGMCGLLAGYFIYCRLMNTPSQIPGGDTMAGALINYITAPNVEFQPMGANMGILTPLDTAVKNKRDRYAEYARRSDNSIKKIKI